MSDDKGQLPEGEMEKHEDARMQSKMQGMGRQERQEGDEQRAESVKTRLALPRCRRARCHICPYGFVIPSN